MRRLALAFTLPLAEIAVFVIFGQWLGVLPVLALVVLAAVAGVMLIRTTGDAAVVHVHRAVRGRENPLAAAGAPAFRVVAALLLIVPGFLTDLVALVLLLPPVQKALLARLAAAAIARGARVAAARARAGRAGGDAPEGEVIDGRAVEIPPPAPEGPGAAGTRH